MPLRFRHGKTVEAVRGNGVTGVVLSCIDSRVETIVTFSGHAFLGQFKARMAARNAVFVTPLTSMQGTAVGLESDNVVLSVGGISDVTENDIGKGLTRVVSVAGTDVTFSGHAFLGQFKARMVARKAGFVTPLKSMHGTAAGLVPNSDSVVLSVGGIGEVLTFSGHAFLGQFKARMVARKAGFVTPLKSMQGTAAGLVPDSDNVVLSVGGIGEVLTFSGHAFLGQFTARMADRKMGFVILLKSTQGRMDGLVAALNTVVLFVRGADDVTEIGLSDGSGQAGLGQLRLRIANRPIRVLIPLTSMHCRGDGGTVLMPLLLENVENWPPIPPLELPLLLLLLPELALSTLPSPSPFPWPFPFPFPFPPLPKSMLDAQRRLFQGGTQHSLRG